MTGEFTVAIQIITILEKEMEMFSSTDLANILGVNPARIRKILSKLKEVKIVGSRAGVDGGYYLKEAIHDLSLKVVYDILDINIISKEYRVDKNKKLLKNIYNELTEKSDEALKEIEEDHLTSFEEMNDHAENVKERLEKVYSNINLEVMAMLDKLTIGDLLKL